MATSGGSAALNGFFQIVHHLDWPTEASQTVTLDELNVKDGCIVLEPGEGAMCDAQEVHRDLIA